MFRVIIAGGRDFDDYQLLKATMDKLLCNITDEITVVCGQAKRFTGVSRHIVTICARYTPISVLPSGICAASAEYRRMVESRDPT